MCQSCSLPLDSGQTEAFQGRMLEIINGGATMLLCSVGHRVGLFDAMATLPPATSREIAVAAECDERYVREWLGGMVAAKIVTVDHEARYALPPEHAALLTRAAGSDNLANPTQFLAVLGGVEDAIVECFREGGGVPYSAFPRFHEVMRSESDLTVVGALEDSIIPLVPGLRGRLEKGIDVLDVGCGSGHALLHLAELFPRSRFRGVDISEEGIGHARQVAKSRGLTNLTFALEDATAFTGSYDLITAFDAIHDQAAPDQVLARIATQLSEGGVFLMQDIRASSDPAKNVDHPLGAFLYTISAFHCMSVSLAAGGMGLGAMWGEERAGVMLAVAGFNEVTVKQLPHDAMNSYTIARR